MQSFERLLQGRYLFHIHTTYTDGHASVDDYAELAQVSGLGGLAFTEHVRRKLDYDFDEFVAEINEARKKYPDLNIVLGIEAKIMLGGGIDAPLNAFMQADIIGIATHSFDGTQEKLEQAWRTQFSMGTKSRAIIWMHPEPRLFHLMSEAVDAGFYIENNLTYKDLPRHIPENQIVHGVNAHSVIDAHIGLIELEIIQ